MNVWGCRKSIEFRQKGLAVVPKGGPGAGTVPGLLYSLVRVLLDAIATSQCDQTKLQAGTAIGEDQRVVIREDELVGPCVFTRTAGPVNQDDHWTVADPEDVEAVGDSRHSALPLHAASILGVFSSGRSRASPILDNNACEPWRTSAALRGFGSRRSVFQRTSATLSRRVTWPLLTARLSVESDLRTRRRDSNLRQRQRSDGVVTLA